YSMKNKGGRPRKPIKRDECLEIRVRSAEKQAFKDAAGLAGVPLSAWLRERLRCDAIPELEDAALPIAFLKPVELGRS
ncbi:MAG: hypothetical protein AB7V46_05365, partial [Thermomicrobiales bacterium]